MATRSKSKCEQDMSVPASYDLVYPYTSSIFDQNVAECYFCQNCSLPIDGNVKKCANGENVCEVGLFMLKFVFKQL